MVSAYRLRSRRGRRSDTLGKATRLKPAPAELGSASEVRQGISQLSPGDIDGITTKEAALVLSVSQSDLKKQLEQPPPSLLELCESGRMSRSFTSYESPTRRIADAARSVATSEDIISGILNWVCLECGGRVGGRTKELKGEGPCRKDWRDVRESRLAKSGKNMDSRPRTRRRTSIGSRSFVGV